MTLALLLLAPMALGILAMIGLVANHKALMDERTPLNEYIVTIILQMVCAVALFLCCAFSAFLVYTWFNL